MPKSTRQYWRQNVERAIPHIDALQGYALAVGKVFLDEGLTHYGDDLEQWPAEYKAIMSGVDIITDLCQQQRLVLEKFLEIA